MTRHHDQLVPLKLGDRALIDDPHRLGAIRRRKRQSFLRKRPHHGVDIHQIIAQKPLDPLKPRQGVGRPDRQAGPKRHQIGALYLRHRRHQNRKLVTLRLALAGKTHPQIVPNLPRKP